MQIKIIQFLPIAGILFGFIIGANVFSSVISFICMIVGIIFMIIGKKWTNKLIKSTNLNLNTNLLLYISILKSCYLAGFSNTDCKCEASKIKIIKNEKVDEILKLTEDKGISPCEMLDDLYNDIIETEKTNSKLKIAQVNAKLMFPLAVCYLPAFIFISLLPIIISLLKNLQI